MGALRPYIELRSNISTLGRSVPNEKSEWKDALVEGLFEIVIYAMCFGLGLLVLFLLGWLGFGIENIDADPVLIGFGVIVVSCLIGYGIYRLLKKKKK